MNRTTLTTLMLFIATTFMFGCEVEDNTDNPFANTSWQWFDQDPELDDENLGDAYLFFSEELLQEWVEYFDYYGEDGPACFYLQTMYYKTEDDKIWLKLNADSEFNDKPKFHYSITDDELYIQSNENGQSITRKYRKAEFDPDTFTLCEHN